MRRHCSAPPAAGSRPAATAMRGSPCTLRQRGCAAITAAPTLRCRSVARSAGSRSRRSVRARRGSRRRCATLFPGTPCIRLDRDVVRRRGDMEEAMRRMASGEARILVGTQMVTKGPRFSQRNIGRGAECGPGLLQHRFPRARASRADHRAGRRPRGPRRKSRRSADPDGIPGSPLLLSLLAEGYDGFARAALAERRQAAWPPFSRSPPCALPRRRPRRRWRS